MNMDAGHLVLLFGVLAVMAYDFTNGFHDAADMLATAIASRAMTPGTAIVLVTLFTFAGPLLGGLAVADTIGEFVVTGGAPVRVAQSVAIAAVVAALTFNLVTWKFGIPTSSSVSLASGLVGAGLYALGGNSIRWGVAELGHGALAGFMKIVAGLFFSPVAGFVAGFFLIKVLHRSMKRLSVKSKKYLVASQYLTVSWLAFSHGTNDAQKGMGVLSMLLFASGVYPSFHVPMWVILLCASSITAGTLFGGWNIIRTVGYGIYKVKLIHSMADQVGSAFVILVSSFAGAPVSTTQVVTTTLVGVGAGERPGHVRWKASASIAAGWALNIPSCLALGACYCFVFIKLFS